MKKLISVLLIAFTLNSLITVSSIAATNFKDVPQNAWYKNDLDYITNDKRKILEGYKGKFNPNDNLTVAQFVKIAIVTSSILVSGENPKQKWYVPYITKAKAIGYIREGEFTNYEKYITRGEMARILIRELESQSTKPTYRNPEKFKAIIKDYKKLPENLRDYIVKTFDLGLIGGYTNGEFGANDKFTRAQAVAVVRRLLDPSHRIKVDIDNYTAKATVTVEGIKFNPYTDTTGKRDEMKLDKVSEFAMVFFNHLQFYTKNGKAYFKGYVPKVPEGYHISIILLINNATSVFSNGSKYDQWNIPNQGYFDKYMQLNRKDIKEYSLIITILKNGDSGDNGSIILYWPDLKLQKIYWDKQPQDLGIPKEMFSRW